LVKIKNHWHTYPQGEKILDEQIVEKALSFLSDKPLDEFTKALERFSQGQWVESAEKSRRTLEEFLRSLLRRPLLGLSPAILEVGKLLKTSKVEEHLRISIVNELRLLDEHYNGSSKHASKTGEAEAEFLLYKVGSLLKLINQLELKAG
jgi:HEPN domain-containing protein